VVAVSLTKKTNFDPSLGPGQLLTACAVAPCTDTPRPEDKKPNARNDSVMTWRPPPGDRKSCFSPQPL